MEFFWYLQVASKYIIWHYVDTNKNFDEWKTVPGLKKFLVERYVK